jgi:hypothetical protein
MPRAFRLARLVIPCDAEALVMEEDGKLPI